MVEQWTENPRVPSSSLGLGTICTHAEVAELVDATVSKTVEGRLSCRFEPDLRHHDKTKRNALPICVVVAQRTLNPLAQVRILDRQP